MTKKHNIFKKKNNNYTAEVMKEAALTGAACGVTVATYFTTLFIGRAAAKAAKKGVEALGGLKKKGADNAPDEA